MIKAIFFDVDGTLFSHTRKAIPDDTRQTLLELQDQGIKIFMSTGRHPVELLQMPVNHIRFDGYILSNGKICLGSDKQMLFGMPFDREITDGLISIFQGKRYPLVLSEADRMYINIVNDVVYEAQEVISTPVPELGSYEGGEIYQATVFLKKWEEAEVKTLLPRGCKFARWCDGGVDIISEAGGKVEGIRFFCRHFGIAPEETMAFGDAENDMDMLKFAGIGVAMGNAGDQVKEIADYVTDDVDHGGIRNAVRHFHKIIHFKQKKI